MDWNNPENNNNEAPKLPDGYHRVKVGKILHGKKDGTTFENKNGDPYILVVFQDAEEREASCNYTLTDAMLWKLGELIGWSGGSNELTELQPAAVDFTDPSFCEQHILGRKCWVYVETKGKYTNADPVDPDKVPAEALQKAKSSAPVTAGGPSPDGEDDDIPF